MAIGANSLLVVVALGNSTITKKTARPFGLQRNFITLLTDRMALQRALKKKVHFHLIENPVATQLRLFRMADGLVYLLSPWEFSSPLKKTIRIHAKPCSRK